MSALRAALHVTLALELPRVLLSTLSVLLKPASGGRGTELLLAFLFFQLQGEKTKTQVAQDPVKLGFTVKHGAISSYISEFGPHHSFYPVVDFSDFFPLLIRKYASA